MKWLKITALGLTAAVASTTLAADHRDGAGVKADPAADINDVFAFMNESNVVLAMTVNPFSDAPEFSDATQYVFHVTSYDKFGGTKSGSKDVICTFDKDQKIQCWIGSDDYVTGDASAESGLKSTSGKVKVFAGPRADPFYFYLTGFNNARMAVIQAVTGGMVALPNANGCPALTTDQQTALQGALSTTDQSKNDFAGATVSGLTLEIDRTLLTANADDVISVWASTNKSP